MRVDPYSFGTGSVAQLGRLVRKQKHKKRRLPGLLLQLFNCNYPFPDLSDDSNDQAGEMRTMRTPSR